MKILTSIMAFFIAILALSLVVPGCSNSEGNYNSIEYKQSFLPTASVLCNDTLMTRTVSLFNNVEKAYFYIRVDDSIPGMGKYPSDRYYPQAIGGSYRGSENLGYINKDYAWSKCKLYPKYVFSTTGIDPNCIDTYPKESSFFSQCPFTKPANTKILWYIAKLENGSWHVDGVLTADTVKDINDIPNINIPEKDNLPTQHLNNGNVEVDINKQVHKDWNEIKTSIHIRDYIDSMIITIPIPKEYIVDQDDTAIRTFEYISGTTSKATVTISHTEGIKYIITADNDYIKSLLDTNKDGLTLEIHSYTTVNNIDEYLEKATVTVYPDPYKYLKGQVSSTNWDSTSKKYTTTILKSIN